MNAKGLSSIGGVSWREEQVRLGVHGRGKCNRSCFQAPLLCDPIARDRGCSKGMCASPHAPPLLDRMALVCVFECFLFACEVRLQSTDGSRARCTIAILAAAGAARRDCAALAMRGSAEQKIPYQIPNAVAECNAFPQTYDTMAKSSRSSAVKKNNQTLKKKVFGPAETARNARQSAKLLELAQQPKPLRAEMDVEQEGAAVLLYEIKCSMLQCLTTSPTAAESPEGGEADKANVEMDVDGAKTTTKPDPRSNRSIERQRHAKHGKVEKRHRKAKNNIAFKKHPMKPGKKGSKR